MTLLLISYLENFVNLGYTYSLLLVHFVDTVVWIIHHEQTKCHYLQTNN